MKHLLCTIRSVLAIILAEEGEELKLAHEDMYATDMTMRRADIIFYAETSQRRGV